MGGLVSEGYSSYGRIFHPAIEMVGREGFPFSWSTIAEQNGRTTHPEMRYWRVAGMPEPHPRPHWEVGPEERTLPIDECRVVFESMSQHTSTPGRCYFCIWEGLASLTAVFTELHYLNLNRVHTWFSVDLSTRSLLLVR